MMSSPTTSTRRGNSVESSTPRSSVPTDASQVCALYDKGRYQDALHHASRALRNYPHNAALWNAGAAAAQALGLKADAEAFWKAAIANDANHADAHYNLGVFYLESNDQDTAALYLSRAIQLDPRNTFALNNLACIVADRGRFPEAIELLRRALEADPRLPEAYRTLEKVASRSNQIAEVRACLERALELSPRCADALVLRAKTSFMAGDSSGAEKDMAAALAADPMNAAANLFVVEHGKRDADARWARHLRRAFRKRGSRCVDDRIKLGFAMGKFAERRAEYDLAFEAYAEGNRLHYQRHPFDERGADQALTTVPSLIDPEMYRQSSELASAVRGEHIDGQSIFIVGMPRSGTTLLEQVLASHPDVFGAGELTILSELVDSAPLQGSSGGSCRPWLEQLRTLGDRYLSTVWAPDVRAPFVVDKMPENYKYAGWIPLLIPRAKIIHIRRDPRDTCFSCFATNFARGHEYSYDLLALARQYDRYQHWMSHWRALLPVDSLLEIDYETLVSDLEGVTRSVLRYIGLDWNESCAQFHRSERVVQTASFAQVKQPLYNSSIGRWRHFERHLSPLLDALRPHLYDRE